MTGRSAAAVLARPGLWPTALRVALRLAPGGWWRRSPRRPWPDERYLAFRLETAYGDPTHPADPEDLVSYLEWCRRHAAR